jgi:hypothetical protein
VVAPPIAGAAGAGASVGAGAGAGSSAFLPQEAKASTSAPDANRTTNFFIFISSPFIRVNLPGQPVSKHSKRV